MTYYTILSRDEYTRRLLRCPPSVDSGMPRSDSRRSLSSNSRVLVTLLAFTFGASALPGGLALVAALLASLYGDRREGAAWRMDGGVCNK